MTDRITNETAARAGLRLFEAAIADGLPAVVKGEAETYGPLRQSLADLSTLLVQRKLVEGKAGAWKTHADRLAGLDDETVSAVSEAGRRVVEETGRDATVYALDAAGKQGWLKASLEVRDELNGLGFGTSEPRAQRDAVAVLAVPAETAERAADMVSEKAGESGKAAGLDPISMLADERLHEVARASLGALEALHRAKPDLSGDKTLADSVTELQGSLRLADFMLPGDSSARKAPYSEQSPRGTREQNETIFRAAQSFVETARGGVAFDSVTFDAEGNQSMIKIGVRSTVAALGSTIEASKPQLIGGHEEKAAEEPVETLRLGNEVLPEAKAKALHALLNVAERIADKAQLDTMSPQHVMYPAKDHARLEKAHQAVTEGEVEAILRDVAKGGVKLPGISDRSAGDMATLVKDLGGLALFAERRGAGFRAISMDDIDRVSAMSRNLRDVGAINAVAALGGLGDVSTTAFNEGKDAAAFATLREAMAGSRSPSPELALGLVDRVLPEMSLAEWNYLNEETRSKARAFVINPHDKPVEIKGADTETTKGRGLREVLAEAWPDSTPSRDPAAKRWEQIRIRAAVRGALVNEAGEPNLPLRAQLMGLRNKAIVSPSRAGAAILREESNRLFEIQEKWAEEQKQKRFEAADHRSVDFAAGDVRRFLAVLEASGSAEPATLVKKGKGVLALEHEEAPTISGKIEESALAKQKDGYRLYKIDAEQLRAAYETGAPAIRIRIADDRPYAIEGVGGKAPAKAREEARSV